MAAPERQRDFFTEDPPENAYEPRYRDCGTCGEPFWSAPPAGMKLIPLHCQTCGGHHAERARRQWERAMEQHRATASLDLDDIAGALLAGEPRKPAKKI